MSSINPFGEVPATETVAGIVELATQAEVDAGIDAVRALTPATLAAKPAGGGGETADAWVQFTGTGTVTINDSFNVTSITDIGVGNYTVNFTTAMANGDYALAGMANPELSLYAPDSLLAAGSFRIQTKNLSGTNTDPEKAGVIVFGTSS